MVYSDSLTKQVTLGAFDCPYVIIVQPWKKMLPPAELRSIELHVHLLRKLKQEKSSVIDDSQRRCKLLFEAANVIGQML